MSAEIPKELIFTVDEYQARLQAVRQSMAGRGIDAFLVSLPENIYYLTGYLTGGFYLYKTVYQHLLVPSDGSPALLIRSGEQGHVLKYSWTDELEVFYDYQNPVAFVADQLKRRGFGGRIVGLEMNSWFTTAPNYAELQSLAPGTSFVDASGIVEELRVVKSPRELEYICQAARVAEAGMRAGIEAVQEGVLDNDVAAAVLSAMVRAGGDMPALGPFVSTGYKSTVMHSMWGRNRIERGNSTLIEIGASYNRYTAALMRTVVVGEPSDDIKRLAEASLAANEAVINAIGPGATSGEVQDALQTALEKQGLGHVRPGMRAGYSVGIGLPPDWGEGYILAFNRGDRTVLRPGMTFHVPSAVRSFPRCGASFSDTVLVTETGRELITNLERRVFVK